MKLETDNYPQEYAQEVHGESQFFDNLRHFAEYQGAEPGEEFFEEVDLIANEDGSVHVVWLGDPLGRLPEADSAAWWHFVSHMTTIGEALDVDARIWTSKDWDNNFYASVKLDLPTIDAAMDAAVADSLTDFSTRDAMNLMSQAPVPSASVQRGAAAPAFAVAPIPPSFTPDRTAALMDYQTAQKNPTIMWILWVLLGSIGVHRFYLGDTKQGILMLIAGLIGWVPGLIWALIDAFAIGNRLRQINHATWSTIAAKHGVAMDPLPEGTYK